jgi:hypothetical protein
MDFLFSAAAASMVAHHVPLASLQNVFSSMANSLTQQWPSLVTQHAHHSAYYNGHHHGHDSSYYYNGSKHGHHGSHYQYYPGLCYAFPFCGATSSHNVTEDSNDMIKPSIESDSKVIWKLLNEGMPSLLDEDDMHESEGDNIFLNSSSILVQPEKQL